MCNRKTRVPAGVKNSSWRVDERAVCTAECTVNTAVLAAVFFGWPCLGCKALLDPWVICDNIYVSCKKDRYVQAEIKNTLYKYVRFEASGGALILHNFVTSH